MAGQGGVGGGEARVSFKAVYQCFLLCDRLLKRFTYERCLWLCKHIAGSGEYLRSYGVPQDSMHVCKVIREKIGHWRLDVC